MRKLLKCLFAVMDFCNVSMLRKIQHFIFRNFEFRIPEGESSSLNFDYILKNFLSVGSNIGQTGVTNVQRMRYATIAMSCS